MEKELEKATIMDVPQGSQSVVCSNIYLDKLDNRDYYFCLSFL